jgi:hypothetical protein
MANRFLTPPKLTFPVDASAEFNGTSDFITTPINGSEFPISTFSISAWVYTTSATGYKSIAGIDASESITRGSFYFQNGNGKWTFAIVNTANTALGAEQSAAVVTNKWYHLLGTFDGSNIKLYVDGSLEDTTAFTGTLTTPTGDALIGAAYFNNAIGDYFPGNLANVAIWNRALSSDEINSVMWKTYEQVSTTEKSGLQAWYKLSADEVLSGDSTATLTTYANANGLTFEAPACVQTALNGLPDITDARLYSANYDIRVSADGGNVESLSCVETELNAIL